jgi:hypothetical protein
MFGNRLGWGISAGIAIGMIGLMVLLQYSGTAPSDETPTFKAHEAEYFAPIALSPSPDTIVPATEDCDAAATYQEATDAYEQWRQLNSNNLDQLSAIDKITEATYCKKLTIFTKDPAKVINFEREKTPIETLRRIGDAACKRAGVLLKAKDLQGARKYAEAAFALGARMYGERVVYEEFEAGLGLMGEAATVLTVIANQPGDDARAKELKAFAQATAKFSGNGSPVFDLRRITKTQDGDISATRAGDVFALARSARERMWRVEACLQLARTHRYVGDNGRGADQRYAQMILRRLADTDPDPIVRLAATRARDITDEEYQKQ